MLYISESQQQQQQHTNSTPPQNNNKSSSSSINNSSARNNIDNSNSDVRVTQQPQQQSYQAANSELGKRKKSKSKTTASSSHHQQQQQPYPTIDLQTHNKSLDDWLNGCLKKENTIPTMTSSSEFLDTNYGNGAYHHSSKVNNYPSGAFGMMKPTQFTGMPSDPTYQKFSSPYQFGHSSMLSPNMPPATAGYVSRNAMRYQQNGPEFTSLPPVVNVLQSNQLNSDSQGLLEGLEHRRFSDPCLAANDSDDNDSKNSDNNSQELHNNAPTSAKNENKKLLQTVLAQISILHDTNSKICRNLHETKVDIEALKHAPSWGLRHRRDSISGLSTHSQPLGYAFGTHSPAPTYHSGMYTPGMMTDVVREVKEAARVREEALLSRVRALVEDRSWTTNETNLKMFRDLEEMKIQINQLKSERTDTNARITKMDEEIKTLRSLLTHALNTSNSRQQNSFLSNSTGGSFNERDFSRSVQSRSFDRQKRHSLSLNYGTINSGGELDPIELPIDQDVLRPMNPQFNDIRKAEKIKYIQNGKMNYDTNGSGNNGHRRSSFSSDTDELLQNDGHQIVQMEKDTVELRRDLQDALAGKKNAESRIQALEHMVRSLQNKDSHNISSISIQPGSTSSRNSSVTSENHLHNNQSPGVGGKQQLNQSHTSSTTLTASSSSSGVSSAMLSQQPKLLSSNTICLTGPVTDL